MEAKFWIEIIAALTIPISLIAVITQRIWADMGLGVRSIQFVGIGIFPSTIVILAMEGILEKSAVGALIGALVGYLFTNIGEYDKKKAGEKNKHIASDD